MPYSPPSILRNKKPSGVGKSATILTRTKYITEQEGGWDWTRKKVYRIRVGGNKKPGYWARENRDKDKLIKVSGIQLTHGRY